METTRERLVRDHYARAQAEIERNVARIAELVPKRHRLDDIMTRHIARLRLIAGVLDTYTYDDRPEGRTLAYLDRAAINGDRREIREIIAATDAPPDLGRMARIAALRLLWLYDRSCEVERELRLLDHACRNASRRLQVLDAMIAAAAEKELPVGT